MSNPSNWQQRQQDFFEDLPAPSNAAHLKWSVEKMQELRPELFGLSGAVYSLFVVLRQQFNDKKFIQECIDGGDSRAAVVMSIAPLLVAAYSDELDAVALLRFPDHLVQKYGLTVGTRLLTVNNYGAGSGAMDLMPGPKNTGNWDNIIPTIAEFVSDDLAQIDQLKRAIPEQEWQRAFAMGRQYLQALPGCYRDGRPFLAGMPRTGAAEYATNLKRAQQNRMRILGGAATALLLLLMCSGIGSFVIGRGGANANQAPFAAAERAWPGDAPPPLHGPPGMPIDLQNRAEAYAVGEPIEALWGGTWVRGEVVQIMPDGFLIVRLSSGPMPTLPPRLLRKLGATYPGSVAQSQPPPPHDVTYRTITTKTTPIPPPPTAPKTSQPAATAANPAADIPDPFSTRVWEDATGKFKIEARLLEFRNGVVHLEKEGGSQLRIPLEKLSAADQEYVRSQSTH